MTDTTVPTSDAPLSPNDQGNDGWSGAGGIVLDAAKTAGGGLFDGAKALTESSVGPWAFLALGGLVIVLLGGKRRWF